MAPCKSGEGLVSQSSAGTGARPVDATPDLCSPVAQEQLLGLPEAMNLLRIAEVVYREAEQEN